MHIEGFFLSVSLHSIHYKIITNKLINRLRPLLNDLISLRQSNFILGRDITYNAITLHEIIHSMCKSKKKKDVTYKIDLEKSYGHTNWTYLQTCVREFGFPTITLILIMHCVTSYTLSTRSDNKLSFFHPWIFHLFLFYF